MRTAMTLVAVAMIAVFAGVGCKTSGGSCCGSCKGAPGATESKCSKCNMDKSACKCTAAAPAVAVPATPAPAAAK